MKTTKRLEWMLGLAVILLTGIISAGYSYAANETASPSPVIVVDPGHGGNDPGKVGTGGCLEKDINLDISLYLRDYLEKQGFTVVMTRTDDTRLYTENASHKQRDDLKNRCEMISSVNAAYAISIHQNSYTDPKVKGAQAFYHGSSNEGKTLAETIQNSIKETLDPDNNRKAKSNNSYYMLKNAAVPTVIVECGFLSNPGETTNLCSKDYQEQLAAAIGEGFIAYYNEVSK